MFKRKDGLWVERIPIPGQSTPKTIYGRTQKAVKQKLLAWQAEQEKGLTVDAALYQWLALKEREVEYKTYEGYKAPVKRIRESFGADGVRDLTPAQVQAFVNAIAARGYKRTTVQRPLDVLRMLYDYLITLPGSGVRYNPTTGVRLPKGLQQENRDLAPREAVEIVKANVGHPFGLFAYFVMYTGMRDQEALAITDKDIADGYIQVNKAVSWQTNQPKIKVPKTPKGFRRVVILSPLAAVLPEFTGYLFSADGGETPLTQSEFRRRWNTYCREVGLATCTVEEHRSPGKNKRVYRRKIWTNTIVPYQLRHEFATLCYDAELDPKDTADLMGHTSDATTRRWYTHIQDQRRDTSAARLEHYITTGTAQGHGSADGTPQVHPAPDPA